MDQASGRPAVYLAKGGILVIGIVHGETLLDFGVVASMLSKLAAVCTTHCTYLACIAIRTVQRNDCT